MSASIRSRPSRCHLVLRVWYELTVDHNVTTAHKLAIDVHLRNGRPVTILLNPSLSSWSSRQLNVFSFSGLTPWTCMTWMTARENPHMGISGVPFINTTRGLDLTAPSIFDRASVESRREKET